MRVLNPNSRATTTVMRSRFFSITVDPRGRGPQAAAEHVGEAATLAGVDQHQEDQPDPQAELEDPEDELDDVHDG